MNNRSVKSSIAVVTATILAALCCGILGGCSFIGSLFDFGSVEFTQRSLALEVGESFDLSRIIESDGEYELTTSNRTVATVSDATVTAVGAGKCSITAKSGTASSTLGVTVTERVPDTITLNSDGALIQTLGSTAPIVFTAVVTGSADGEAIVWSVDGIMQVRTDADVPFVFSPSQAGEFVVTASPENSALEASETVRAYHAVTASGHVDGSLSQTDPAQPLTLTVALEKNPNNPDDYIRWFVDGKVEYAGNENSYLYVPDIGAHTLTLEVNGVRREIDGKNTVDVFVAGSRIPTVTALEFDNMYPHAYLVHDAVGAACVEIVAPDGSVTTVSQHDPEHASRFGENTVDVGGLVDICASSSARRAYKFRMRSLGDGGAYLPSEYGKQFTFTQLPSAAQKYLGSTYCDKDRYITSDAEFVNLLEYEIINRPKTSSPSVSFDCYMGYTFDGSAEDLWDNAFEIAATSGKYTSINVDHKNGIFSVSFKVNTVNNPSKQTYTGYNSSEYTEQLHAIMPHINYDEDKYRADDYIFAIDTRERTQTVTYTDELYFAAENNSRPVPTAGSAAETVYRAARDVMRKIVTDDMTDTEKAHAVYDWVMWQVTYDTPATEISKDGEAYSAYYLEGVFGDGATSIDGVKYYPYAVCDGISKAYSLLCNIEGIPCVRVAGIAGESLADARGYGHAWNKVFVDGGWYVVDCTWGDVQSRIRINGIERDYELALHDHLFLTDAQADLTHFEGFEAGDTDIIYAPQSATRRINVYESMTYNGVEINCSVGKNQDERKRVAEIARAFAETYRPMTSVYVPGGVNNGAYSVDYQAFEIYFEDGVPANDSFVRTDIQSAIRAVLPRAETVIRSYENIVLVLVK